MAETNHTSPGLSTLLGRLARTGAGALRNRGELLAVEWQEEKARLTEMLLWAMGLVFLGLMGMSLLTGIIIFLLPSEYRLYAAGGFAVLYLLGAVAAWLVLRSHLRREPFSESLGQLKKDSSWLASLQ